MAFCHEFNTERPHEGIEMEAPASRYASSPREIPERLAEPSYDGHLEVRRIGKSGSFRWRGRFVFLTTVLTKEYVGFDEIDDGLWNVLLYDVLLARYDERMNQLHT